MDDLLKNINSLKQVEEIEHYIDDYSPIYLSGLTDGFKPHLVLTLFKKFNETCLVIAENEKKAKKGIEGLQSASGFIRKQLSKQLHVYQFPELNFFYDESMKAGIEMIEKLNALHITPEEPDGSPEKK